MEERKRKWAQSSVRLLRKVLQSFLSLFRASDNRPVPSNATTDLSTSFVTVPNSIMSDNLDNPLPQSFSTSIPSSIEELFSRIELDAQASDQNSTQPESFPSCSLEELFGIDAKGSPIAADLPNPVQSNQSSEPLLLEKLFEVQSHTQPVALSEDEPSGSELVNDLSNVRTTEMILEDPNEVTPGSPMSAPESKEAISTYQEPAPSDHHSEDDLNPPPLDLSLDDASDLNSQSLEPLEPENTLLSRASQGDLEAFCQLLNEELAAYNTTIVDIESRPDLLQISLSGERVPVQTTIEPLIKSWVLDIGFVKVQKIELYGHRDGSELPYWRSEFNPSELEYIIQPEELGFEFMQVSTEDFSFLKFDVVETPSDVNPESRNLYSPESTFNTLNNPSVTDSGIDSPLHSTDDSLMLSPVEFLSTPIEKELAERPLSDAAFETSIVEDAESIKRRQLVENFTAQYAAGERAFIKIDLSETDLSGINLTLADLQDALLIWANLQDASLYHVNLSGAKLRHANLKGAKLRSANLQGTDFLNADLSDADLSWSNLRGANLTGANLSEANLQNAILENVIMPDGTLLD